MDKNIISDSRRKIAMFAGQFLLLILCVWYIGFFYYANIYPDKLVKATYEETNCKIIAKNLLSKGKLIHRYRADFLVSYSGQGVIYQNWISGNGLDRSFTTDHASQQNLLSQFEVGSRYPCWHNPEAPQMVVLLKRHNWSSMFPLFIPAIIALIIIYYFGRGIIVWLTMFMLKSAKIKNKD